MGSATFHNSEAYPREVSIGGSGTKYSGIAYDDNADGVFDRVTKRTPSPAYSIGELEQTLLQVSTAIRAGKQSIVLQ